MGGPLTLHSRYSGSGAFVAFGDGVSSVVES